MKAVAYDMKTMASPGIVYIAVSVTEEDVCRIGIAAGESAEAAVRQWSDSWHVFAERSVSDAFACVTELDRRLERRRNTATPFRREFLVQPDEAERILDRVARGFPLEAREDDAVVLAQDESVVETHEEPEDEREWKGANGHEARPIQAALIHDPPGWLVAAPVLLFVFLCAMAWPLAFPFGGLLVFFWISVMYPLTNRLFRGWGVNIHAKVSAGPEGLVVDGRLRAPTSSLRTGLVVPDESRGPSPLRGPTVLLERKRGWPLMIRTGSVRDARSLLRALGLDASQKTFTRRALCGTLTIGIDGIACSGSDGLEFFFSSTEVKDVSRYHLVSMGSVSTSGDGYSGGGAIRIPGEWGVDLELHDGRSVRIPVSREDDDRLHELIEERIRECLDLSRESHVPDDVTDALRRRGRSVEVWLQALRAIGSGANADHRTAPVPTEKLWDIIESTSSTPDDRIAAAATLGASEAEVNRDRLRILVHTTSSPRVRFALAAVAEQDEEALVESLAALEDVMQTSEKGE